MGREISYRAGGKGHDGSCEAEDEVVEGEDLETKSPRVIPGAVQLQR
jgi:hypothetical protein